MKSKVYSCSMFFNELDLLELKLETLDPVVDYFVISESNMTHSGKPKPFNLENNFERYKKFHHKIIYQQLYDTPSNYVYLSHKEDKDKYYNKVVDRVNAGNWWNKSVESYGRDTFEKESLLRALACHDIKETDIILLSDLDEIINPLALEYILKYFDYNITYHFWHDMFYYYLNLQKNEDWYGTIAVSFNKFLHKSFCEMRTYKDGLFINNGGWHFSFQGGAEKAKLKLQSYGEQSLNLPHIINSIPYSIDNAIELGRDLFGRPCKFTLRDVNDGTFPQHLVEHQNDIYKDYIKWK